MAFNEEATLAAATEEVVLGLRAAAGREFEVLLVDDGSRDQTPVIAARLADKYPEVRVLTHAQNRGPGSALITGFAAAQKDIVCFTAADQQIPFAEIAAQLPLLDDYEMVVGRRTGRPGYSWMRLLSSQVYIWLVHRLFGLTEFEDFNFVYLYRRSLLEQFKIESQGVFLCTELLIKAVDNKASITSATISCYRRKAGKATCGKPRVIAYTFGQMMNFWWHWQLRRLGKKS